MAARNNTTQQSFTMSPQLASRNVQTERTGFYLFIYLFIFATTV